MSDRRGPTPREVRNSLRVHGFTIDEDTARSLAASIRPKVVDANDVAGDPNGDGIADSSVETLGARSSSDRSTTDEYNAVTVPCHTDTSDDAGGPLRGLSVGVKDCIAVANVRMRCGTDAAPPFEPRDHATVVRRLLDAGASIEMKTNMDAFTTSGKGVTGEGGPIRNPRDVNRVAGGSSGGSAVVVADGQVDVAVGTDTGGSVRIPAAFCGVLGLKPTYGLVSRAGVLQNSHSLDAIGFLSESTTALAAALEHVAGVDSHDAVTSHVVDQESYRSGGYVDALERSPDIETITIGVPDEVFDDGLASEIESLLSATATELSDAGVSVHSVSIPDFDHVSAVKDVIARFELAANWQYGAVSRQNVSKACEDIYRWMFDEVKPRGSDIESSLLKKVAAGVYSFGRNGNTKYLRARRDQDKFRVAIDCALQTTDVLLLPTTPITAPHISDARTLSRDLGRYTLIANVTGHPAITLPMGGARKTPIGLQLIGEHFSEGRLLGIGRELQRWSVNSPNVEIGYPA